MDANPTAIDRVIVDLRANGGGDSRIISHSSMVCAHAKRFVRGHPYALVGPATFSSGLLAAFALRSNKAILVRRSVRRKAELLRRSPTLTLLNSKLVGIGRNTRW